MADDAPKPPLYPGKSREELELHYRMAMTALTLAATSMVAHDEGDTLEAEDEETAVWSKVDALLKLADEMNARTHATAAAVAEPDPRPRCRGTMYIN